YPNNQTFCDNVGDIHAVGTTNGYIHVEFDQDWLAKGFCGSTVSYCNNVTIANEVSTGSISLDLQGFVYWDENHWELHPLAAWRLTPPPPPADFSIGASPSSLTVTVSGSVVSTITLTSLNGLAGAGSLSASISSSDLVLVWPTVAVSLGESRPRLPRRSCGDEFAAEASHAPLPFRLEAHEADADLHRQDRDGRQDDEREAVVVAGHHSLPWPRLPMAFEKIPARF